MIDQRIGISQTQNIDALIDRIVRNMDPTDPLSMLITGPTGCGKGLLARSLHNKYIKRKGPFIDINCAGFPDNLLESELLGYVQGAFTGAVRTKEGLLERAANGTFFMDEIGDLPIQLQVKILKILEDRRFRRLGSVQDIPINPWFLAATSQDLRTMVEQRTFRQDLFYRINVFTITLPALKDHQEDIPDLVRGLCVKYNIDKKIQDTIWPYLVRYPWPGNIRELENMVRGWRIWDETTIGIEHLSQEIRHYTKEALRKVA